MIVYVYVHVHVYCLNIFLSYDIFICLFVREDLALSLSSAQEEAGSREREWREERERREAETQDLSQRAKQLQSNLTSTQQEKTEASYMCNIKRVPQLNRYPMHCVHVQHK